MERPLVVMTPKSLLRLPAATSNLESLTAGGFKPVIEDSEIKDPATVERIVLCSGKVFYDLNEARKKANITNVSIVRLEQFYPFPLKRLSEVISSSPNAKQLVWAQEEPQNMGGWTFVEPRLKGLLSGCETPIYVGRAPSASPATGSYSIHQLEQAKLIRDALAIA